MEKDFIEIYKKELSEKLNWNEKVMPIQRDFQYLSDQIFDKTNVCLSVATLRRIWSNKYENVPQVKTLNALAHFLDYQDWEHFRNQHYFKDISFIKKTSVSTKKVLRAGLFVIPIFILVAIVIVLGFSNQEGENTVTLNPVKSVHNGVPATIGFEYEIEEDNIFIELSWNPLERTKLNPNENYYTGTYFYPDYHKAKLLKNNETLIERSIYITSNRWKGMLLNAPDEISPVYLDESDVYNDGTLKIHEGLLSKYNLSKHKPYYSLFTFSNQVLESIHADNFEMTVQIKVLPSHSTFTCQTVYFYLKAEHGNAVIPITQNGCHGQSRLLFSDRSVSGKHMDLEMLSSDLTKKKEVKVLVKDQKVSVILSNNEMLTLNYSEELGKLKVIKVMFTGFGEVHNMKVSDKDSNLMLL